jgi:cell division protein FtsN
MPPKPSNREEEFELVLGNKQLLSLFFIVVGFFAAFFSVGYMVGFGHGEKTGAESGIARVEEPAPKPEEARLPSTLLEDPLAPPPPITATNKPSPTTAVPNPVAQPAPAPSTQTAAAPPPKQTTPVSSQPAAAPKPSPTAAATTPKASAAAPKTTPKPASATPAKAASSGSYVLQVAALRVLSDANQLAAKLKAKGYPATVNAAAGDGWQRVVVGPFESAEAAQAFKTKLTKDGFDTMLRKR